MINKGPAWIVLADGRKARILEEPRRGAALSQLADLSLSEDERYEAQDSPGMVHERMGPGRHGTAARTSLHEQEEENFLDRVAGRMDEGAKHGAYEELILIAPPRALGYLRNHLTDRVRAKVTNEVDKDLLSETIDQIAERLRALRLP